MRRNSLWLILALAFCSFAQAQDSTTPQDSKPALERGASPSDAGMKQPPPDFDPAGGAAVRWPAAQIGTSKEAPAAAPAAPAPEKKRCRRHCSSSHWWLGLAFFFVAMALIKKRCGRCCGRMQEAQEHMRRMENSAEQSNAKLQKIIEILERPKDGSQS